MSRDAFHCPECADRFLSRYALGQHLKSVHPSKPVVLNRRDFPDALPPNSSYVGRGSPFGNRFRVGVDGDRDRVIDSYIAEKSQDEEFLDLVRQQLRGHNLVCHCAPERCHADWLLQIANPEL